PSLRSAMGPVPRTPPLIGDGCHPDGVIQFQVEDRVREPADDVLPQSLMTVGREGLRHPGNLVNGLLDLVPELGPEPLALLVVIGDGGAQLGLRLPVEVDRLHGRRSRNSAKSCSAGLPTGCPPRISATRRASSTSQASATPSSSGSSEQTKA